MKPIDYDKLQEQYKEFLEIGNLPPEKQQEALHQLLRRTKEKEQHTPQAQKQQSR